MMSSCDAGKPALAMILKAPRCCFRGSGECALYRQRRANQSIICKHWYADRVISAAVARDTERNVFETVDTCSCFKRFEKKADAVCYVFNPRQSGSAWMCPPWPPARLAHVLYISCTTALHQADTFSARGRTIHPQANCKEHPPTSVLVVPCAHSVSARLANNTATVPSAALMFRPKAHLVSCLCCNVTS